MSPWELVGAACLALLNLGASAHILLHKQQPRSAFLWLMWVWLVPVAGTALYWYFGYNRVGKLRLHPREPDRDSFKRVRAGVAPLEALGDSVTGSRLRRGCRVDLLEGGERAYPAMLKAIRSARRSIHLQTYIFDLDAVGTGFLMALAGAAQRGVQVRVLLDGVGAWGAGTAAARALRQAGAQCLSYWRLDRMFRQPLFNLRNHRKLMVVDGREAYCGGLNVSARYAKGPLRLLRRLPVLRATELGGYRDLHFRCRGAVVEDLAKVFQRDWAKAGGGEVEEARPELAPGREAARAVPAGPDEDFEKGFLVLLGGLRSARRSVDLCTPYFIPDSALLSELRLLSHAGVRVRVHVPRNSDHPFVHWAVRQYYGRLLEAGVEVWELRGAFVHSKAAVVDGRWCFVGSSNLDPRSFNLNFELDLEVHSPALAGRLEGVMARYRRGALRVGPELLARRGLLERLRGGLANLMSPYL